MTQTPPSDQPLQWKLFIRRRASATQGTPPGKDELKWVANTTTLIHGKRDALLVDTFLWKRRRRSWLIGLPAPASACPRSTSPMPIPIISLGSSCCGTVFQRRGRSRPAQVVDPRQAALAPAAVENWRRRFPGLIPSELASAERLYSGTFDFEDHQIVPIDIGHTDTDHTTCLHVPSIGLVIADDAIYNGTHPDLVESNRQGLGDWLAAIDKIEALNPRAVVVGHGPMEPDNAPRHITGTAWSTKRYLNIELLKDQQMRGAITA
jgi:hypothetical protein